VSFPTLEAACRTAVTAVAAGAGVRRLELIDPMYVRAVNVHAGTSYPEVPCLFFESAGTEASVQGDLDLVLAVAEEEGAVEVVRERDADARSRLWAARHNAAYAWSLLWPGTSHCTTDVCVPLAELPDAVTFARETGDRLGLRVGIVGHVGDGNFHAGVTLDADNPDEVAGWHEFSRLVVEDALARGGTCTGEHGVGMGKIHALELEHPDLVPLYHGIKQVFDPNGIMNPGKVVPARA
jgi:D-lactate dehydrogenase (cytochrome)